MGFEDIYPTLGGSSTSDDTKTSQKTNPNDQMVTGKVAPQNSSIFNIKGSILGQPIIVWIGMIILLIAVKFLLEEKAEV